MGGVSVYLSLIPLHLRPMQKREPTTVGIRIVRTKRIGWNLVGLCHCTIAVLHLLLVLNGSFHRSANLLLRAVVVVVGKVLVLDLERRSGGGDLACRAYD